MYVRLETWHRTVYTPAVASRHCAVVLHDMRCCKCQQQHIALDRHDLCLQPVAADVVELVLLAGISMLSSACAGMMGCTLLGPPLAGAQCGFAGVFGLIPTSLGTVIGSCPGSGRAGACGNVRRAVVFEKVEASGVKRVNGARSARG